MFTCLSSQNFAWCHEIRFSSRTLPAIDSVMPPRSKLPIQKAIPCPCNGWVHSKATEMNCPLFVARKATLQAGTEAEKEAKTVQSKYEKRSKKAAAQRAYRKTQAYRDYRQRWHSSPACKWAAFRAQARSRKIDVAITKSEYVTMVVRPCVYCGEHQESMLRGIDRLDSKGVYCIDNIVPCCAECNFMKNALPVGRFLAKVHCIAANAESK